MKNATGESRKEEKGGGDGGTRRASSSKAESQLSSTVGETTQKWKGKYGVFGLGIHFLGGRELSWKAHVCHNHSCI